MLANQVGTAISDVNKTKISIPDQELETVVERKAVDSSTSKQNPLVLQQLSSKFRVVRDRCMN